MSEVKSVAEQIASYIAKKLYWLQNLPGEAARSAELARMRRGLGDKPGNNVELWGTLFDGLPEELTGKGREPSRAEWAIYTAMTTFALHQQGRDMRSDSMHQSGQTLGLAVAQLARREARSSEAVRRRFNALATAQDMPELIWHLRGLVQLLRSEALALDYPKLAQDLFRYQDVNAAPTVRLRWGRDFYREYNRLTKPEGNGKDKANG